MPEFTVHSASVYSTAHQSLHYKMQEITNKSRVNYTETFIRVLNSELAFNESL